ncbi:MAG: hypothetical protein K8R60_11735 [Burkholderiales bacterium]|nr:hypothetical protein [Burkholderiales bacterium]
MSNDLPEFLSASSERQLELLADPEAAAAMKRFLGDAAFAELERLKANAPSADNLALHSPPNLVFVPGVMGSMLQSVTQGGVWWLNVDTRNFLNHLRLAPDGTEDADPNDQIAPFNVDFSYQPFAAAVLAREDFGHRMFAYDWRKMYSQNSAALRDLILDMRVKNGGKPVHIVAHSMGGLMVRATLKEFGDELWPLLGRIAFIGTPHYGSASIAGYLKNHLWGWEMLTLLRGYLERRTFRSLWGVLTLLPAPAGIYPGSRPGEPATWKTSASDSYHHPCANFDLYDARAWQLELDDAETKQLQAVLDAVAAFHTDMHRWHNDPADLLQQDCDRMLMVAGVGYQGLFRLAYVDKLGFWKTMDKITDRIAGDRHRDGDGRVPLASAELERVRIKYVRGVHGGLTNIPAVYEDVFRWLNGQPLEFLADTPEDAFVGHGATSAMLSVAPHLDGSSRAIDDDPGYLQLDAPTELDPAAVEQRLATGGAPGFNLLKIL